MDTSKIKIDNQNVSCCIIAVVMFCHWLIWRAGFGWFTKRWAFTTHIQLQIVRHLNKPFRVYKLYYFILRQWNSAMMSIIMTHCFLSGFEPVDLQSMPCGNGVRTIGPDRLGSAVERSSSCLWLKPEERRSKSTTDMLWLIPTERSMPRTYKAKTLPYIL